MMQSKFERYLVRLHFTRPASFHFNHGGPLMGLLCRALGTHELPAGIMPFACESGRARFAAGDFYQFGLTLAGAAAARDFSPAAFRAALAGVGAQTFAPDEPRPTLAGNFEAAAFEPLPPPDLNAQFTRLRDAATLTLRFLSPLRVERPEAHRRRGAGFLNGDCFPPAHFVERLACRLFLLAHERYPSPAEREEIAAGLGVAAAAPAVTRRHLLWLDLPLEGGAAKRDVRPKGYTLGGVVGEVVLTGVPAAWLEPLVLGQYLHVGEKTHYGLGRYVIKECGTEAADEFLRPAANALERLSDPALLQDAIGHVLAHSTARGADGRAPADYAGLEDSFAEQLSGELQTGAYRCTPLLGFVTPKGDGGVRPLVVPTVRDRAVQRAACELLGPAVETLLEDCSYAYRKGYSRAGAARAIERAYDEGYRYVLDADIESFFDAVEWERLFAKLHALFPFEPLVGLIEEWVKSPVSFEGTLVERERGLPQGIAIAPLLANLYLDELDEELLGRDYRLVRYGDDFVVLCRDLEAARTAREDARRKLAAMGLTLSEGKTAVRSFEEGFTYLGYLFCRALVLERPPAEKNFPSALEPDAVPALSWLARVPFRKVRALVERQTGDGRRARLTAVPLSDDGGVVPLAPAPVQPLATAGADVARPLYLTSFDTTVRREGETLIVCAPGQEPRTFSPGELTHMVCYGRVRVTVPVLLALCERGVPTYFCRWSGELRATFGAPPADWPLWLAQARTAADDAARVRFAREVVAAKLHNYAALAVRFHLARAGEIAEGLRALERECVNKSTLEALNGMEGRGAALYFGAMRETLAPEWNFSGRQTRPPPDPVNAMLSFGYTLLYHHLSTALFAAGLNPRVGLYHTERGAYHALACDMQEEFRHLVDGQVWAMINRGEVKPEDFYASEDGRYPCLLSPDLRRKFINTFEKRLASEFTVPDGETISYRAAMDAQARRLKCLVAGAVALYHPLRTRGR